MNDTRRERPPVPLDVLRLRSATTAYLEVLRAIEPALHQIADVNRIVGPEWGELLDQVRTGLLPHEMGTPAAIGRVLAELLGEVVP